ncbi:MAG: hypothetical protein MJE68_30935 [Proteobacteria bacterium]|nr:hypothetical protein [Pseudomonadota bacterium]
MQTLRELENKIALTVRRGERKGAEARLRRLAEVTPNPPLFGGKQEEGEFFAGGKKGKGKNK